jgi:hypothetical protein
MLEDDSAVAVIVPIGGDAVSFSVQQIGQGVLALLDRRPAQILAVQFNQIEGAEHGSVVMPPGTEQIKDREAIGVDHDRFAVDEAGPHWQAFDGFDNPGETISEVGAIAGVKPHVLGVAARQDVKAVVLDLMDPVGTGWRLFRWFRQAGLDRFMREDGAGHFGLLGESESKEGIAPMKSN